MFWNREIKYEMSQGRTHGVYQFVLCYGIYFLNYKVYNGDTSFHCSNPLSFQMYYVSIKNCNKRFEYLTSHTKNNKLTNILMMILWKISLYFFLIVKWYHHFKKIMTPSLKCSYPIQTPSTTLRVRWIGNYHLSVNSLSLIQWRYCQWILWAASLFDPL